MTKEKWGNSLTYLNAANLKRGTKHEAQALGTEYEHMALSTGTKHGARGTKRKTRDLANSSVHILKLFNKKVFKKDFQ